MPRYRLAVITHMVTLMLVTMACGSRADEAPTAEAGEFFGVPVEAFAGAPVGKLPILHGEPSQDPTFAPVGAVLIGQNDATGPADTAVCTGTLIAADAVLTAAHCRPSHFAGVFTSTTPQPAQSTLPPAAPAADTFDPMQEAVPPPRSRRVRKPPPPSHLVFCLVDDVAAQPLHANSPACACVRQYLTSPQYVLPSPWDTGLGQAHDLAVLVLDEPLWTAAPAVILDPAQKWRLVPGAAVDIAGFGRTQTAAANEANMGTPGRKRVARSVLGEVGLTEMVVSPPPCLARKTFGDSGGPTFVQTPLGPRLAGITSRLVGLQGEDEGTVDTRVDTAAAWLAATLQAACDSGERPTCSPTHHP